MLLGYQVGPRHRKLMHLQNNIKGASKSAMEGYPLVAAHMDVCVCVCVCVITMLPFDGDADSCAILQRENGKLDSYGSYTFGNVHLPSMIPRYPVHCHQRCRLWF
jgi:hypothetical protein